MTVARVAGVLLALLSTVGLARGEDPSGSAYETPLDHFLKEVGSLFQRAIDTNKAAENQYDKLRSIQHPDTQPAEKKQAEKRADEPKHEASRDPSASGGDHGNHGGGGGGGGGSAGNAGEKRIGFDPMSRSRH